MNNRKIITALLLLFVVETASLIYFMTNYTVKEQDAVLVNEILQSVQEDFDNIESHNKTAELDYVVIDMDGAVLYRTRTGLSESINEAVIHRDTVLDIKNNSSIVGKIIIYNDSKGVFDKWRDTIMVVILVSILVQCILCIGYIIYLNYSVIRPFHRLKNFAQRVAGGNLDIPLDMDRQNIFGAFTESFDIMRSELKKARIAEAEANASKKELVAKLSHDIKTPVASIKAAAEVGAELAGDEKLKNNYIQIISKTDQINTLVTNLFTASLEELTQISVSPYDMESSEIKTLLENSDYLQYAKIPQIPDCVIYADGLRLQQVFDNIFANSYKYAGTPIDVMVLKKANRLEVCIEDYGGGVAAEELPLLKEKFRRGANVQNIEGAGLGLYISDYFMQEMKGELILENGNHGLKVTVLIPFSI
ncbi:MAG: HAMP domain-containing histidine kinase [Lachnospiraceae bacterium]|nr:HAMP domain-containing histidine kinase [Lachnospiraceae bacterium]